MIVVTYVTVRRKLQLTSQCDVIGVMVGNYRHHYLRHCRVLICERPLTVTYSYYTPWPDSRYVRQFFPKFWHMNRQTKFTAGPRKAAKNILSRTFADPIGSVRTQKPADCPPRTFVKTGHLCPPVREGSDWVRESPWRTLEVRDGILLADTSGLSRGPAVDFVPQFKCRNFHKGI